MNSNMQGQNSKIKYRIAQTADLDQLYLFAETNYKLKLQFETDPENQLDDMDFMMKVWESRFRKEALEHYLKLGWSFIAEDEQGKMVGFFLGQPLLFFQGQTQTLWVEEAMEDFGFENQTILKELLDIAYKLSREKHFQRVIYPKSLIEVVSKLGPKVQTIDEVVWLKTTK